MNCLRCQGLMMAIRMKEAASCEFVSEWRCLLCGEVIDSGVITNRNSHRQPIRCRARPPGSLSAVASGSKRKDKEVRA